MMQRYPMFFNQFVLGSIPNGAGTSCSAFIFSRSGLQREREDGGGRGSRGVYVNHVKGAILIMASYCLISQQCTWPVLQHKEVSQYSRVAIHKLRSVQTCVMSGHNKGKKRLKSRSKYRQSDPSGYGGVPHSLSRVLPRAEAAAFTDQKPALQSSSS